MSIIKASTIKNIDYMKAIANGVFSPYELDAPNAFVCVISFNISGTKHDFIVPCINKRFYIEPDDDNTCEIISQIITKIVGIKGFPAGIAKATVMFKVAPEHSKVIKKPLSSVRGLIHYAGAKELLEKAGYSFAKTDASCVAERRDYTKLLSEDPVAAEIAQENAEELKAAGATYDGLSKEVKAAFDGIVDNKNIGMILAGGTGTGKSWAARIIAAKLGAPYLNIQIDRGTTPDDLMGTYVPKTQADGNDARWQFVAGPLLKAFSEGWPLILEEVNFGDPGVLAKLNQFTDGTSRVEVNGTFYTRNPNFIVLMTMNPGYGGTEELNAALKNRFSVVQVPPLTKKQFSDRMVAYSKKALTKEFFDLLFDYSKKIEKIGQDMHENIEFSIRNAQRFVSSILVRGLSFDEFAAALNNQYINCLSLDNDNCEKIGKLKVQEQNVADVSAMYALYNFAEEKTTDIVADFSTFVTLGDDSDDGSDSSILDESDLSALLGGDADLGDLDE